MKLPSFKKKYVAGALAAGLIMGAAGLAAAYFTATGNGTGKVQVGHATPFTVTQNLPLSGYLYPGQSETVSFNIHNTGHGIQHFSITTAQVRVDTTGGNIVTATSFAAVAGCKSSWFTSHITGGGPASGTLNPGGNSTLTVIVTMNNGTGGSSNQDACQTKFPALSVTFTGPVNGFALFGQFGGSATWAKTDTVASLSLSIPLQTGEAAGIVLTSPPATLPTTAPTFKTNAYLSGSPRWVIVFTNGGYVFGYPSNTDSSGLSPFNTTTRWQINTATSRVAGTGHPWTLVQSHFTGKTVTAAYIVMDTDQAPPSTSTITTVTYGGLHF